MTGMTIDLFTVALMVILAFICGYSAGHKYGREEVRKSISNISENLVNMMNGQKKPAEEKYDRKLSALKNYLDNKQKERDTKDE